MFLNRAAAAVAGADAAVAAFGAHPYGSRTAELDTGSTPITPTIG